MIAVLIAGAVGMLVSLAGTRALIWFFKRLGKGQPILGAEDHGPVHQMAKQGTPTMGGIAILFAGFVGWLVAHLRDGLPFSDQAAIIWLTVFVLATVGFLDDYLKVKRQHNRGIFWKKKGWITFGITAFLMFILASTTGVAQTISFTRAVSPGWELSGPLFIVWTAVMVWSTTNAVNVTVNKIESTGDKTESAKTRIMPTTKFWIKSIEVAKSGRCLYLPSRIEEIIFACASTPGYSLFNGVARKSFKPGAVVPTRIIR